VTHVFVSPHPDDAALSCGGLIANLRARGKPVAIVTIFCGPGPLPRLTPYQRLALGFGAQEKWQPGDDAFDAGEPGSEPGAEPGASPAAAGSPAATADLGAPTPAEVMAVRRAEDEAFARFASASIQFVGLPDAVFRGYQGDAQLMGPPRADDPAPIGELRTALAEMHPSALYLPLSIGGHVDHRQARRAAIALLAEPGSLYLDRAIFYEDFPYALNTRFEGLGQLDPEVLAGLPAGVILAPEYVGIEDVLDRKLEGLRAYASQHGRLFGGDDPMAAAVREQSSRVGRMGGTGPSERYWRAKPA
jgi:LmbE family N-acetylglucosaminyl deacetylase